MEYELTFKTGNSMFETLRQDGIVEEVRKDNWPKSDQAGYIGSC